MGADHPITWCKTLDGGRSFYTGLGHTQASYAEPAFRTQLLGGIRYAAKRANADCRPETGYTTLYNGSTTGWSQAGPGSFTNTDATLTSSGGMGLLWYSAKQFTLLLAQAGLAADRGQQLRRLRRLPEPRQRPERRRMNNGYEVQIDATDAADRTTGAIYGFKSADIAARDAALNPPGEWNTYELLVEGERLQVYLNGDADQRLHQHRPGPQPRRLHRHPEPRHRRRRGRPPQHPDQGVRQPRRPGWVR